MTQVPEDKSGKVLNAKMLYAYWNTWKSGVLVLKKDWLWDKKLPLLSLEPNERKLLHIKRAPAYEFGLLAGYYGEEGQITFVINCAQHLDVNWVSQDFYVVGEFNDWGYSIGNEQWKMQPKRVGEELCFVLTVDRDLCVEEGPVRFKFASSKGQWLSVPWDAPNWVQDSNNNRNYEIQPDRTGLHRLYFEIPDKTNTLGLDQLVWKHPSHTEYCKVRCGKLLLSLQTDKPLGAKIESQKTTFSLFAPRAKKVTVHYYHPEKKEEESLDLYLKEDTYWQASCPKNLHGYYYYYRVDGDNIDSLSQFDPNVKILDPYALATVARDGPGIIIDRSQIPAIEEPFIPPKWHDLVILEAHIRDLLAKSHLNLNSQERLGFQGLEKFIQTQGNYIQSLGINALELQPLQAFDNKKMEEYHWGYMPINYFSPAFAYASGNPGLDHIKQMQSLVKTCHKNGLALIVDVVYNHFGEPNHLTYLDKYHYFDVNDEGYFINFSGCGNDIRANAPMAKRLIIDSLLHWIKTYDVDGFRFDLAELLGTRLLLEIEVELKKAKPSIILIAEPWSFKGHIATQLKSSGFASWNDGYRNFLHEYLLGHGNWEGIEYYIKGSMGHIARFPAQSVNYASSHDDHCWLDAITENPNNNGQTPTIHDRQRTHLMMAILMMSIGIPMLAQGTDLMHTKLGINNTYKRSDLNSLDYDRGARYSGTHEYCRQWIQFRLSPLGQLLRLQQAPTEGYFKFFRCVGSSAIAVLYNADASLGKERLLFAINPHVWEATIAIEDLRPNDYKQVADHERFCQNGLSGATLNWNGSGLITLPALSCGLWVLV